VALHTDDGRRCASAPRDRAALPDGPAPFGALALTDAGRDVLDGTADRIRLAGIDRWWGGVHLHGHEVPWRWDRHAQRVARIPDR
jgi:hypothetical protein